MNRFSLMTLSVVLLTSGRAAGEDGCDLATEIWLAAKQMQARECDRPGRAGPDTKSCHEARELRQRAACAVYAQCGGEPHPREKERCAKAHKQQ